MTFAVLAVQRRVGLLGTQEVVAALDSLDRLVAPRYDPLTALLPLPPSPTASPCMPPYC